MKPLPTILCLLLFLEGHAQSSRQDSNYYALLKDSQKIYSNHLQLKCTNTADKYLELDNHRQIPIEQVHRFHSRSGVFVTVPGSAGTDIYRVEREGPKISVYSRLIFDPAHQNDSGYTPTQYYYYRKTGQEKMQIVTYPGLQNAMADKPASLRELHLARSEFKLGIGITVASLFVEAFGLYESFRNRSDQTELKPPPLGQPLPPLPSPSHTFSPLVIVGAGGLAGGLVLIFGAHRHELKALDIYNR
ncbi:MAG: hypothetical protein J0H74_07290 [Chitinophagaceae bacterium]|nr:hypothetical protein [Chitinophagaceae bacterium]